MSLSEDEIIATLFAPMVGPGGLGLRDDAAVVSPRPDEELVVTVDALVSGVHFFQDDPPEAIAAKALSVNLSDLAAKAADPAGFLLALALPGNQSTDWLPRFAQGLQAEADAHRCPLLGGDTVRTPGPLTLSITAFGTVPRGRMLPRTGARPGDLIYVSGTIGDAALGLQLRLRGESQSLGTILHAGLDEGARAHLLERYLRPRPRLRLTQALRRCAHGGMDVSDGLVGDATKMLRASGVSGRIDISRTPLSPAAKRSVDLDGRAFVAALTGGDDYEILACVPPGKAADFKREAQAVNIAVTCIGEVSGGGPPVFVNEDAQEVKFERGSFQHF